MINVYLNRGETLVFDYELSGLSPDVISARICIEIEGVDFCFPAVVTQNQIIASIPALNRVTNYELPVGATFNIRLEVIGSGFYLVPWRDNIIVNQPIQVKSVQLDRKSPRIAIKPR